MKVSQKVIDEAYEIVRADLLSTFRKMKDGESLHLTNLGTFAKR
jgi:hypothetical protein